MTDELWINQTRSLFFECEAADYCSVEHCSWRWQLCWLCDGLPIHVHVQLQW